MMVFDESASPEENAEVMNEAMKGVTTLSLTHAVRDAEIEGLHIKDGQVLGLVNGKVKTVADADFDAVEQLLDAIPDGPSFLSIYCGADAVPDEAVRIEELLRERFAGAEVLSVQGGQPLYDFVISAE